MQAQKLGGLPNSKMKKVPAQKQSKGFLQKKQNEFEEFSKMIKKYPDYCYFSCNKASGVFVLWLKETNLLSTLSRNHTFGIDDSLVRVLERLDLMSKKNPNLKIVKLKSFQLLFNQLLEHRFHFIILPEDAALRIIEDNEGIEYKNMSISPVCTKNCTLKPDAINIHANSGSANVAFEQFMRSVFLI